MLSSTEAECVTMAGGCNGAIFLMSVSSCFLKAIDVRQHIRPERVSNDESRVVLILSERQHADFPFKPQHKDASVAHKHGRKAGMSFVWVVY